MYTFDFLAVIAIIGVGFFLYWLSGPDSQSTEIKSAIEPVEHFTEAVREKVEDLVNKEKK